MKKRILNRKRGTKNLALIMSILTVATIGMVNATTNLTTSTFDVRFIVGSDSQTTPTRYPAATVSVASSTTATVTFSFFSSATNSPQPVTCYSDLLRIQNLGSKATINSVILGNIVGASNLGNLCIYLYASQTNNPQMGTPIASVSLNSSSSGTINLLSSPYTLGASAICYIEVVGYASSTAAAGSKVSFTANLQIGSAQAEKATVFGAGSLLLWHSAGTYGGDFGSVGLFGFNVKSAGNKVNGEFGLTIRHVDSWGHLRIYQIRSSHSIALEVTKASTQTTVNMNFTGAIVRDITNPFRPITLTTTANVHVDLTDYSRKPDTLAITVTSPSGQLYFSNNWVGGKSVEQNLLSGTISIG